MLAIQFCQCFEGSDVVGYGLVENRLLWSSRPVGDGQAWKTRLGSGNGISHSGGLYRVRANVCITALVVNAQYSAGLEKHVFGYHFRLLCNNLLAPNPCNPMASATLLASVNEMILPLPSP